MLAAISAVPMDNACVSRLVVLAAISAVPVDNPSGCRASQLQALPGAFGSGSRPDGPVASGHPCPPLPECSIPAALAWPSVFAAALRNARHPQGLSTSQASGPL
ncbi:hypothetical protein AAGR22_08150 [Erwinia sp. HDF1-3R]|uniref:hypothetical protein n=1 Tax=Erwinia sp. HDF1-3R TaxID=3141543 RepID=UPI0031F59E5D